MINNYHQRLYPNPFRYRNLKNINNDYEILDQLTEKLKPFLLNKFSEIDEYFDEFCNPKSEIFILRLVRNTIKDKYDFIIAKTKSNFLTKRFTKNFLEHIEQYENQKDYQKNLRYLELPVQPLVDRGGFEIQSMSNDLIENILEEIDTGINYIYDYCSDKLPESIDLWEDYALFHQNDFPIICHDQVLEATYRSLDRIFNKIQKGSIDSSNWVISGDMNSRIMKIIRPKYDIRDLTYCFSIVLESLISLAILIVIFRYIVYKLQPILTNQKNRLLILSPLKIFRKAKKSLNFKKFRVNQKIRNLKTNLHITSFKINLKYKLLQLIINKSIL